MATCSGLRVIIEIAAAGEDDDDGIGITIRTESFDPGDVPENVGAAWVALCRTFNEHMRAHGCPDFDCLQRYELQ